QVGLDGSPQAIVGGMKLVISTVPGADRLAGDIVQHPALAGPHTGLVDAVAEHVIIVTHDDTVLGIEDLALVAFDVEHNLRSVKLFGGAIARERIATLELVVGNGEKGAPKRIEV